MQGLQIGIYTVEKQRNMLLFTAAAKPHRVHCGVKESVKVDLEGNVGTRREAPSAEVGTNKTKG